MRPLAILVVRFMLLLGLTAGAQEVRSEISVQGTGFSTDAPFSIIGFKETRHLRREKPLPEGCDKNVRLFQNTWRNCTMSTSSGKR